VGNGSPAAKAGIQPGDRVVGEWSDVLRRINAPVGSSVALKIERGGHSLDVAFTLSDFL
jgi:S1-C subfamily serine protease